MISLKEFFYKMNSIIVSNCVLNEICATGTIYIGSPTVEGSSNSIVRIGRDDIYLDIKLDGTFQTVGSTNVDEITQAVLKAIASALAISKETLFK